MTVQTWHFYALDSGQFTGQAVTCEAENLAANTPVGCGACTGVTDWLAQRRDLVTGEVIDWQPPAPPDDTLRTWAWNGGTRRWQASPTTAALAEQGRRQRDQLLAACDWRVVRASETGVPMSEAWTDYRQALRDVPEQPGFPATIDWPVLPA